MFNMKFIDINRVLKNVALASLITLTACSGGGGSSSGGNSGGVNASKSDVSVVTPSIIKMSGEQVLVSGKGLANATVTFESNNLSPTTQTDSLIKVDFPAKAGGDYKFTIDGKEFDISYYQPYTKVVAGDNHTCGILPNKNVECWGSNSFNQVNGSSQANITTPTLVDNLANVTDLALGMEHTCALLTDKTVKCWGRKDDGRLGNSMTATTGKTGVPTAVIQLSDVTAIFAGKNHTCAIISGGNAKCWGDNQYYQINHYTSTPVPLFYPRQLNGITNIAQLSLGRDSSCALLTDKTVKCWGRNNFGQAGSAPSTTSQTSKDPVTLGQNATQITAGERHHCALLQDKSVKCWGHNGYGQLGNSTTTNSGNAVQVKVDASGNPALANVERIVSGGNFNCALLSSGAMKCWGNNNKFQLGTGSLGNETKAVDVKKISNATGMVAGNEHTCATFSNQAPKCWGANLNRQLGWGTSGASISDPISIINPYDSQPRAVAGLDTVKSATGGEEHTCALLTDGHVKCWGDNGYGQLGNSSNVASKTPVEVTGISDAVQLSAFRNQACVLLSDGGIKCWGFNGSGQLGNNKRVDSSQPVSVNNITNAKQVVMGHSMACALLKDKTVKCWGDNSSYQFLLPTGGNTTEPVDISGLTNIAKLSEGIGGHACAVTETGKVMCWGANGSGQLGDGSTNNSTSPKEVPGITNAIDITVGENHSCAVLQDKTVTCWGDNGNGELGVGKNASYSTNTPEAITGLTGVSKIIAYGYTNCAILEDYTAKCWGSNYQQKLGNPAIATVPSINIPSKMTVIKGKIDNLGFSSTQTLVTQGTLLLPVGD